MSWSELVNIVAKLRSPEGCPWDRAQTHTSLKRFLLEEAYELLEAIDQGDPQAMKDELGDVLLQVLLHAQIAAEQGQFSIDDVIVNLSEKLVRRHPHVFGEVAAETPEEVMVNWDAIKRREKTGEQRRSILDGVPKELPALMRAEKIQKKAAKVGFDWDHTAEVVEKVKEEFQELEEAAATGQQQELEEELGDLLFAMVNLARFLQVDPEFALQKATAKFVERFQLLERYAEEENLDLQELDLAGLNDLWDRAKAYLRRNPHS
ncbi:MAG TPA: nucleoside triphosphate pyrophosphohydrolase [Limnochordia bacterium]|nr:nucleoside triphosphate pyrophosphohydrolase [Limnochordia bacterium]